MAAPEQPRPSASPEVPPTGEQIHLPGGSIMPLLLTVGLTFAIVGITTSFILVVLGGVLTIVVFVAWILAARREYDELPLEHHH